MRKKLFTLTLLLAVAASIGIMYASTQIGDLYYNLDASNQTAEIARNSVSGDIVIPAYVTYNSVTYSVTSIGDNAFKDCTGLTSVTIPNSVTCVGSGAFSGCSGLTSITIPNSVISIGNYAFEDCSGLTSLNIPNNIDSIKSSTFSNCTGLTSISIPNSVTNIGENAFSGCSGLTSITIPNSVKYIGNSAFYECTDLTYVTIGNSVDSIGNSAFSGCSSLTSVGWNAKNCSYGEAFSSSVTSVTFGDEVEYIPNHLCQNMNNLTTITIPNSVKEIGEYAFNNCVGLRTVTMSNQVQSIGAHAFENCTRVNTINLPNTLTYVGIDAFKNTPFISSAGEWKDGIRYINSCIVETNPTEILANPIIREGTTVLFPGAFKNCSKIESLSLPEEITIIPDYAFYNCFGLTSIVIPNSVTSIGDTAFYDCRSMASLVIGSSVTSIGKNAFRKCSNLTSVTLNSNAIVSKEYSAYNSDGTLIDIFGVTVREYIIGDDVTSIGDGAFWNNFISPKCCLTLVAIPNSVTRIGLKAFYGCENLTSIEIPNSVTSIGLLAFSGCSSLTSIEIPNSVTSIEWGAFDGCSGLISVTIPNSVTSIESETFAGCSGLTSITIPNSITNIELGAFKNCSGLTSVTIPNSVTSIGNSAFSGCSGLKGITLGHAVESIGNNAFDQCPNVLTIYSYLETPPVINNTVFAGFGTYMGVDLYIPEGAKANYEAMDYWKDFYIIEGLPDIIDNKLHYTLDEQTQTATLITSSLAELKPVIDGELIIPDTIVSNGKTYVVTAIGNNVFKDNSTITTVVIPSSVTQIGDSAFYGSSITSVVIGGTEVPAPNNTAARRIVREGICCSIGAYAFANCKKLTKINFLECVSAIGEGAFKDCSALTTINSKMQNPPVIDETVFEGCGDLGKIALMVPEGSEETYKNLAVWKEFLLNASQKTYTITFVNWDNTELLKLADVQEGTLPVYTAELPTRPEDDEFTYSFIGWTPEIVPASEDATYTAAYEATPKAEGIKDVYIDNIVTQKLLRDCQILILRGDKIYTLTGQRK